MAPKTVNILAPVGVVVVHLLAEADERDTERVKGFESAE
jgi:hypothetical protein